MSPTKPGQSSKNSVAFPSTPSSRQSRAELAASLFSPRTPSSSPTRSDSTLSVPSTPVHQKGAAAETEPATPTSSRRQALYDRIRQKSLTATPTKGAAGSGTASAGEKFSKDQLAKMGQDELRRRCLLGRLGGVAESVWM
jgi:hypothetical protein